MQKLNSHDAFKLLCKSTSKWGVYISFYTEDFDDLLKSAPYLEIDEDCQVIIDGQGFILCDSEEEMDSVYNATGGDDGPQDGSPRSSECRVYALTCGPDGKLLSENT